MSNSNVNDLTIVANPQGNPLTFEFQAVKDGQVLGEGYVFMWKFSDGGMSEFPEPIHTFAEEGEFEVSVEVTGEGDGKGDGDKTSEGTTKKEPTKDMASKKIFVKTSNN